MKITITQLMSQLRKPLAPAYWLSSDEVFLQQQAADSIRQHAKQQGYVRQVFHIDAHFNHESLISTCTHRSLFDDKLLLELQFQQDKLSDQDKSALQSLMAYVGHDICLLMLSGKIDATMQKAKWFNTLTENIFFVPIWPIAAAQYPTWIKERCLHHEVHLSSNALSLLCEETKGNVLACDQFLQQLKLLYGSEQISAEMLQTIMHHSAQTDLFSFVDIFLAGNTANTLTHLQLLKNQQVEPILIIWALARELRQLHALQSHEAVHIWPSRQSLMNNACKLFPSARIDSLIREFALIDLQIKGVKQGSPYQSLERILSC